MTIGNFCRATSYMPLKEHYNWYIPLQRAETYYIEIFLYI